MTTATATTKRKPQSRSDTAFLPDELLRLAAEAAACEVKQAEYVRLAVLFAWSEAPKPKRVLPVQPFTSVATPKDRFQRGPKVTFTPSQRERLDAEARLAGLTQSKYMRQCALACWGEAEKPKPIKAADRIALTNAIGVLGLQVKKLGTNVNQLAKQANAGLVPIKRSEVEYVLGQLQIILSMSAAAVEKVAA